MTMGSHDMTSHSRMATQIPPLNSPLSISITGGPHLYPNIRKIIRKIQKSRYPKNYPIIRKIYPKNEKFGYPKNQRIRIRIIIRIRIRIRF